MNKHKHIIKNIQNRMFVEIKNPRESYLNLFLKTILCLKSFLLHVPSLLKSCQMALCDLVSVSAFFFVSQKRFGYQKSLSLHESMILRTSIHLILIIISILNMYANVEIYMKNGINSIDKMIYRN